MTARTRFFGLGTACIAAVAAAAIPVLAQELPEIGDGHCFYADRYAPLLAEGVIFANCNSLRMERSGDDVLFNFIDTRRKLSVEFRTRPDGKRWEIVEARQQNRRWRAASGACELYFRDAKVSTVTCYTTHGVFRYAANFEVGRGIGSRSQPELRP